MSAEEEDGPVFGLPDPPTRRAFPEGVLQWRVARPEGGRAKAAFVPGYRCGAAPVSHRTSRHPSRNLAGLSLIISGDGPMSNPRYVVLRRAREQVARRPCRTSRIASRRSSRRMRKVW
jgi:hypothetical protein